MKKKTSTSFLYDKAIDIAQQQAHYAKQLGEDKSRLYTINISSNLGSTQIITNSEDAFNIACATENHFYSRRSLCFKDFDRKSYTSKHSRHIISASTDPEKFAKNLDNAVLMSSPAETITGDPSKRVFTLVAGDNLEDVTDFILDQTKAVAEYNGEPADKFTTTGMSFVMLADAVVDGQQVRMQDFYSARGDRFSSVDTNLRYLGFSIMHDMNEAHEKNTKVEETEKEA